MRYPYEVDKKIAEIFGNSSSCFGKIQYISYQAAKNAAIKHNQSQNIDHKVAFYFCHCGFLHLGRTMHIDDVRILFNAEIKDVEEKELHISLLDEWWKFKIGVF